MVNTQAFQSSEATSTALSLVSREAVEAIILKHVAVAMATGAIPVSAVSGVIIAENAVMIAVLSRELGVPLTLQDVISSAGALTAVNWIGRNVFVEGARLLGWGTGGWGIAPICVLGATTAGLQTWVLGQLTIAVATNGGNPLSRATAAQVQQDAHTNWSDVRERARSMR